MESPRDGLTVVGPDEGHHGRNLAFIAALMESGVEFVAADMPHAGGAMDGAAQRARLPRRSGSCMERSCVRSHHSNAMEYAMKITILEQH
jgi:hypothetical protein